MLVKKYAYVPQRVFQYIFIKFYIAGVQPDVLQRREHSDANRTDEVRPAAGLRQADEPRQAVEADRGVPGSSVRHAADGIQQVQSDQDAVTVGRGTAVHSSGSRVSSETARHQQRDGRARQDA